MIEILSSSGFVELSNIRRTQSKIIELNFESGKMLRCSPDHLLKTNTGFQRADSLSAYDVIETADGDDRISSMSESGDVDFVYDVCDVGDYYANGISSHNCEFLGSSNTLFSSECLHYLSWEDPISIIEFNPGSCFKIYDMPKENHSYCVCVDVSEGTENDHSVVNVIDITEAPYHQVAIYRSNTIDPVLFSDIVAEIGNRYNEGFIIIENNSVGKMTADRLFYDNEYENILSTKKSDSDKISETSLSIGIRTTKKTKVIGCSHLKSLVEKKILIIHDYDTIQECFTFVRSAGSYAAEKGKHDDCIMTLVLFAWLVNQEYFKDLTSMDSKELLKEKETWEMPIGFVNDGIQVF